MRLCTSKARGTGIARRSPEYVAQKMLEGKAIIAKMNVDDDGVKDICARYGITNIPNMKLFKNGVEVGNVVGAVPKATVKGVIDKNL